MRIFLGSKRFPEHFLKWVAVGLISLFIDTLTFTILFQSVGQVFLSNLISAIFSTSFNYAAHYFWTFNSNSKHKETLIKYMTNVTLIWLISSLFIIFLIEINFTPIHAKLLSLTIILPINFIILKRFIYNGPAK